MGSGLFKCSDKNYSAAFQFLFRRTKSHLVPDEIKYRRVLWGLAQGCYLPINLRWQLRTWIGVPEIEIAGYFRKLIEKTAVCYDIGAANGYYTVSLAKLSQNGVVAAFEPDERLFVQLRDTIDRNTCFAGHISAYNLCVGLQPSENVTTLDRFVVEHSQMAPNFIKIDVDGPEYEILEGGRETIARFKPRFIIEVHSYDLEKHCISLLNQHGYLCKIVDQQTLWPEQRPSKFNRWVIAVDQGDVSEIS